MAHAYYHARSSARHFGGVWEDYMELHRFLDSTKEHIGDNRHRLLLHNTWGITIAERIFGIVWTRPSDRKCIPTRTILEKHILEDMRTIPSLEQCFAGVTLPPWIHRNALPLSQIEERTEEHATTTDALAVSTIDAGV